MRQDQSAARGDSVPAARHRTDCADFYYEPQQTELMYFRAPDDVVHALEDAAEQAGRMWNNQVLYVLRVCQGAQSSPADRRTVREWQSLMARAEICFEEGDEDWRPCHVIFENGHAGG